MRSIDNLFSKFEDMLITSETCLKSKDPKTLWCCAWRGVFTVDNKSLMRKLLSIFFKEISHYRSKNHEKCNFGCYSGIKGCCS